MLKYYIKNVKRVKVYMYYQQNHSTMNKIGPYECEYHIVGWLLLMQ